MTKGDTASHAGTHEAHLHQHRVLFCCRSPRDFSRVVLIFWIAKSPKPFSAYLFTIAASVTMEGIPVLPVPQSRTPVHAAPDCSLFDALQWITARARGREGACSEHGDSPCR